MERTPRTLGTVRILACDSYNELLLLVCIISGRNLLDPLLAPSGRASDRFACKGCHVPGSVHAWLAASSYKLGAMGLGSANLKRYTSDGTVHRAPALTILPVPQSQEDAPPVFPYPSPTQMEVERGRLSRVRRRRLCKRRCWRLPTNVGVASERHSRSLPVTRVTVLRRFDHQHHAWNSCRSEPVSLQGAL